MSRSKRKKTSPTKHRNPLHNHPLLTKGGAHEKPPKAHRRAERVKLRKEWTPLCA